MNKKAKKLPVFKSEDQERDFWAAKEVTEVFDPNKVISVKLTKLKPSKERITLRLPSFLLSAIRREANKKDIPYQSLIKEYLYRVFVPKV